VACAGSLAAILLHSLADFNLYIPANAMLLAWIAGLTVGIRPQASKMSDLMRQEHPNVITVKAVAIDSRR
jgi:hypothetical protein